MAARTRVGSSQGHAQVGTRDPDAVIPPRIHLHVRRFRHVAFGAGRACGIGLVEVVSRRVVLGGRVLMACRADLVAILFQSNGMGIVAVGAADSLVEHLALDERSVLVVLIHDLPIRIVRRLLQQLIVEVVVVVIARPKIGVQYPPPRMARCTRINLRPGVGALESCQPVPAFAIPEPRVALGQLHMHARRAMAGLAAHIDLRKRRVIRPRLDIVVLLQIGRVAVGTHVIPALRDAGPMHGIVGTEPLRRVGRRTVDPFLLQRVPRNPQDLESGNLGLRHVGRPIELNHVLLQRSDAERVLDLEVRHLPVGSLGVNHEPLAVAIHAGREAIAGEFHIVEITQHGVVGGQVHSAIVIRSGPLFHFRGMTFHAGAASDKRGLHIRRQAGPPIGKEPSAGQQQWHEQQP